MNSEITAILTLYKTPLSKLNNLSQYKNFNPVFFDQQTSGNSRKILKKNLNFNFRYYFSKKNIGLSKSSNFLLKKVRTKFCLFTQPDIKIDLKSINLLKKSFKEDKDIIFSGPSFERSKKDKKNRFVRKLNAACMLCDVKKLRDIGFFDEDFFLYWEDMFLMNKINKSKYKMIFVPNAKAEHMSSQSSANNMRTTFLREMNFMYGEFVYDYKLKKIRIIKVFRKIFQFLIIFFFKIVFFKLKDAIINLAKLLGVLKYLNFYCKKKLNIF